MLEPIQERLRNNLGRVRRMGPDYLLYVLLDVIVDFASACWTPCPSAYRSLSNGSWCARAKRDLRTIRSCGTRLWSPWAGTSLPTRELAGRMSVMEHTLIEKGTKRYLNDLQDHTVYIAEHRQHARGSGQPWRTPTTPW